ncbi:hypothetical protein [Rhodovastum atsumiense]|uniref:Uncharacterized protein n=1 Tax=Rhodovastum atsumiense TaxID=504468 RepID=A0A5M6IIF4_9PROT|nr:hypothetical protein [Rhodovastum atsumiense]KAA5607994.1 hypothetical protein F1189_31200 [Rhodovastum atsumiense]
MPSRTTTPTGSMAGTDRHPALLQRLRALPESVRSQRAARQHQLRHAGTTPRRAAPLAPR